MSKELSNESRMESARFAVANGVKLLDKEVPGWWKVIKLDKLQMAHCSNCMLGQLFGYEIETALGTKMFGLSETTDLSYHEQISRNLTGYQRGLKALETNGKSIGCDGALNPYNYTDLKCAWAEVIADRRAKEGESSGTGTDSGACEAGSQVSSQAAG